MSIIFTGNKQSISKRQHNHLNTSTGNNVNPCDKMSKTLTNWTVECCFNLKFFKIIPLMAIA